jgi:hypothetical protein
MGKKQFLGNFSGKKRYSARSRQESDLLLDYSAKNGTILAVAIRGILFGRFRLMMLKLRPSLLGAAVCALIYANASVLHASTIIKLNLGGVGPDLAMNAGGVLGTVNDGIAGTTGDQNTNVEYTSFLEPIPDINASFGSFTLSNLVAAGPPIPVGPGVVVQNFAGGTFSLYDPSNSLLLSGLLTTSSLTGTLGPPGTGAVFTTNVASVTGGALGPFIVPTSLALSMNLTNVNGGAGFSLNDGVILNPFLADSFVNISGDPTDLGGGLPEPGSLVLATIALVAATAVRRRAR